MALIQVGPAIEAEIGSKRRLVLITVSQLASGLAGYNAILSLALAVAALWATRVMIRGQAQ